MSRLPDATDAQVGVEKIRDYLLNPDNDQNGGKAHLFERVGFERDHWILLADALRAHPLNNDVVETIASTHGIKYVVECHLQTPDDTNPCFRSIWIIEPGKTPRLVTAY